jgi:hypothetical protein
MLAPAALPPSPAPTLKTAFRAALAVSRTLRDPAATLRSSSATVEEKLAALDVLQSRLPGQTRARRVAALDAMAAAASSAAQPPAVRAKAYAFLGYSIPPAADDAAADRALRVLLAALPDPRYRLFVLRGLGPAAHGIPEADEAGLQGALLDLLDGPVSGEERATALVALYGFVGPRDDLARRKPALPAQLDARLTARMEADPAGFVRDPRGTPESRQMAIAVAWVSAREREALGDPAPARRMDAVLDRLAAVETDPTVRAWIRTYRTAPPPPPFAASATRRAPAGPDAP